MSETRPARFSSLGKKYIMAGSGLVLVLFVLGHLLGNLQIFSGTPGTINKYAHFLKSLGIWLWVIRFFLLGCVTAHVWTAISLARENKAARPVGYTQSANLQSPYAARTMLWSGFIVLAFILFHLADFTLQAIHPIYESLDYPINGQISHDVYAMIILGFTSPVVSLFYIVAVCLLGIHLSHGVSSMFQSVGVRNEKTRRWLHQIALAYGLCIFVGYASIPAAVLISKNSSTQILPVKAIEDQIASAQEGWSAASPTGIFVDYLSIPTVQPDPTAGPPRLP